MDQDARELEDQERFRAFREKMRVHVEQVMDDYMARANPVTSAEVRSHFQTIAAADRTLRQLCDLPRQRRPRQPAQPNSEPKPTPKPRAPSPEAAMLRELSEISRLLDKTSKPKIETKAAAVIAPLIAPMTASTAAPPPPCAQHGKVDASAAKPTVGLSSELRQTLDDNAKTEAAAHALTRVLRVFDERPAPDALPWRIDHVPRPTEPPG